MPPAPVATANRPLVAPTKARYFKGKPVGASLSDSDESDEDDEQDTQAKKAKARSALPKPPPPPKDESLVAGGAGRVIKLDGGVKMNLGALKLGTKVEVKREVKAADEESEEESEEEDEGTAPVAPAIKPPGDESSEYETDSEEESEEEKKPAFRPVFVKKDLRNMTQEKAAAMAEEAAKQAEEMEAQRKLDSKELAGETIRRELAEKEVTDLQPDVDDTDGLDPAGEFEEWRARELRRLLRDKEAQAARDAEQEEIERRRAMPEEQRLAEDLAYAEATRAQEKGEMGFLQKYYHKGAFHQDDDSGILNRDYTGATESQMDMSLLPKVMQVRNFGKMSRTKYTHLTDQDTTYNQGGGSWGKATPTGYLGDGYKGNNAMGIDPRKNGEGEGGNKQGCWNCGGPHMRKDCPDPPQNGNGGGYKGGSAGAGGAGTSANNSELRGNRYGGGGGGDRPRDDGRDRYDGGSGRSDQDERRDRHGDERRHRDRDEGHGDRRDRNRDRARDGEKDRGYERRDDRRDEDRRRDRAGDRDRHRERDGERNGDGRSDRRREDDRERDRHRDRERDRDRDRDREKEKDRERDRERRR